MDEWIVFNSHVKNYEKKMDASQTVKPSNDYRIELDVKKKEQDRPRNKKKNIHQSLAKKNFHL